MESFHTLRQGLEIFRNMVNRNNITKTSGYVSDSFDREYYEWISELSQRYRQSQIKAAVRVNSEMLRFYWSVGMDIEQRQFENKYGSHFYKNLSRDLSLALNKKKGFSPTSLWYTKSFYCLYYPLFRNLRQDAENSENENLRQVADDFCSSSRPQSVWTT